MSLTYANARTRQILAETKLQNIEINKRNHLANIEHRISGALNRGDIRTASEMCDRANEVRVTLRQHYNPNDVFS